MAFLSFNEKAWDKIRPSSVKKTGVSEAIRAFEKVGPAQLKDLTTLEECTTAGDLLEVLQDKLKGAKNRFDPKKNADAVKTVSGWIGEVGDRCKMITLQNGKLLQRLKDELAEAQTLIEGYVKTLTQMRQAGQSMVSDIQDEAKAAVIAGAKGETAELDEIDKAVKKQAETFIRLRNQARNILPGITKEFYATLPSPDDLPKDLAGTRNKLETLYFKVKVDVDYFDELDDNFEKALALVENARKKGSNVEEAFIKVVQADVDTCQQMVSEAGSSETAIDVDLKSVGERLEQAKADGADPGEKSRVVTQATAVLKDAAGKIKRFQTQLVTVGKQLASKTKSYPDFVNDDNPAFKVLLGDIERMRDVVNDMQKDSLPKFVKRAQSLGGEIANLRKV